MCGQVRASAPGDAIFDVPDMNVLDVEVDEPGAAGADH
jgi:hypothetical protein